LVSKAGGSQPCRFAAKAYDNFGFFPILIKFLSPFSTPIPKNTPAFLGLARRKLLTSIQDRLKILSTPISKNQEKFGSTY